jgi:hypothetical protein
MSGSATRRFDHRWQVMRLAFFFAAVGIVEGCSSAPEPSEGRMADTAGDGDDAHQGDDTGDGDGDVGGGDDRGGDGDEGGNGDGDDVGGDVGDGCMLGEAGSFATDEKLDLFGETIYFAKGKTLPAGRYRVNYDDGCMKYNFVFPWTVNSIGGSDGWWLVKDSPTDKVTVLPGKGGSNPFEGFANFADCVAANKALPPKEFDFDGGKLGIWLNDSPYDDNLAGEGGRNPKWKLTLLVEECPPELILL